MTSSAVCSYCEEPVDQYHRDTWRRISGWERQRRGGGTNHVALRKPSGHYACSQCMSMLLEGRHPMQLQLALGKR